MKSRMHFRMKSPRFPGEDKEQWAKRNRKFMYEEAIVKYLIRQLQLPTDLRSILWAEHKSDSSDDFGRLTLSAFCLKTRFPVWLGSRQLKDQRQLPLSKLLRDFHSTHMCRAWMDTSRSLPDSFKWSGLVFSVPGTKFMSLHTFKSDLQPGTTRVVIPQSDRGVVVLEPLNRLLNAIGPRYAWKN